MSRRWLFVPPDSEVLPMRCGTARHRLPFLLLWRREGTLATCKLCGKQYVLKYWHDWGETGRMWEPVDAD